MSVSVSSENGIEAGSGALLDKRWERLTDGSALPQRVAEQLAQAIIQGELPSGSRLSEPELATAFGISRTPVREALYLLERDELVERLPRRGARVAHVSAKQALDVYVCRAHLYGLSARICAKTLNEAGFTELHRIVSLMDEAVAASNVKAYFQLNIDFHDFIGRSTGNDMLLRLMGGMGRVTLRFRFMSLTVPGRMEKSLAAHHELLLDLRRGDPTAAENRVRNIVSDAGDAVLAHFFDDTSEPVRKILRNW